MTNTYSEGYRDGFHDGFEAGRNAGREETGGRSLPPVLPAAQYGPTHGGLTEWPTYQGPYGYGRQDH